MRRPRGQRRTGADVTSCARNGGSIGRYGEPRLLYTTALFASEAEGERRTVHLGVDIFAPEGTTVRSAFPGVVHAAADNAAPLDYGPVIILEHETDGGDSFYTLYGHLSRQSLGMSPENQSARSARRASTADGRLIFISRSSRTCSAWA